MNLLAIVFLSLLALGSPLAETASASTGAEIKIARANATEQYERDVDEVALASQDKAIQRLVTLIKKYQGTRQEPILLSKLGDLQQQNAAILFRISHGTAHRNKTKTPDMSRFQKGMNQAITTFTTLIRKYPNFEEIAHTYYLRGKGYEELGDVKKATEDYLHLVKNHADSEDSIAAYMSLAEFSIQANDHARAISHLVQVEKHPESPHYPFALYKLAWSHYNLKEIPTALSYAERQIAYYNARNPKPDATGLIATSDNALRENTLQDLTVFYFEGYEQKNPQYQLAQALPYFKKIESGPPLGKMLVRFTKLLRSHGYEADIVTWKDQVLRSEADRSESLDVLLTVYEFQLNRNRYPQVVESVQDILRLHKGGKKYESFPRAQKMVLDTAEGLQALVIKNKNSDEVRTYSNILVTIYDAFTKLVEETDTRIPRVHYNLAETLFVIKDYVGATDHYRWIVDHGKWPSPKDSEVQGNVADASLKAIASRYEVLRQKQLIPTELSPRVISKSTPNKLDPLLSQWIEWVGFHAQKTDKDIETFVFESNRALYSQGHVVKVMENLAEFTKKFPKSKFAIPAASLMLDTLIASEDWERTQQVATEFMKHPEFQSGEFSKRLFTVASDSAYKRTELLYRAKDYAGTLKNIDEFLKKYGESARLADALSLAGNAALESPLPDGKKRASGYFARLIREASSGKTIPTSNLGAALLARGKIAEERFEFAPAASDYKAFLTLPSGQVKVSEDKADELRRKTLTLIWLSNDTAELRAALNTKAICSESLATDCEKYSVLSILASPEQALDSATTEMAFDKARKNTASGSKDTRVLWGVVALEGSKNLAFRDRNLMIRTVTAGWSDLDPLMRFAVLPYLTVSIPKTFQINRLSMREVAPLRADERYITRRVEVIREMENAATKAVKLPWARIRAEVLNEIAGLYLDLARGLSGLNPPKGLSEAELASYQETIRKLVMPFEEKGQEMRGKAFEIASKFAIEDDSFRRITEPFFAENPSQAKKLRPAVTPQEPAALDLAYLEQIDPSEDWKLIREKRNSKEDDAAFRLKSLWAASVQAKRWPQVAFFMQEAQDRKLLPSGVQGAVKAISLAAAGARGEALSEIDETRKDLAERGRSVATSTLLQYYSRAYALEKTQALHKEKEAEEARKKEKKSKDQA